jgi:hypothetical protein
MDPTLHVTIKDALRRVTAREMSLAAFRDWFGPVVWQVEESENSTAVDLAYEIAGLLSEYDNGHWSEADLLARLAKLVGEPSPAIGIRITS